MGKKRRKMTQRTPQKANVDVTALDRESVNIFFASRTAIATSPRAAMDAPRTLSNVLSLFPFNFNDF